ncbi:MAG: hypothetical protein ACLTN0_00145 [Coprococcus phoceensis]
MIQAVFLYRFSLADRRSHCLVREIQCYLDKHPGDKDSTNKELLQEQAMLLEKSQS